jgi:hypothetical protein
VVDVTDFNGRTWLDQSENFVDKNEQVVERFTMTAPDTIIYKARVDDPTVFSRPWTVRVRLRRQPKNTELIEYDCIEGERDEIHYRGAASQKHEVRFCFVYRAHCGERPRAGRKARDLTSVASGWLRTRQTRISSMHT